jgi:acyl-CoA thioesterase FadM
MNLLFRLVAICLGYIFDRRRMDHLGTSRLDFHVWPFDLDLNMHMNNGRYLSIMDLGRLDLIVRVGLIKSVIRKRWMPVLASAQMRYRVPLFPFEKFRLETKIIWWDEKWFFMEQRFIVKRGHGKDVVAAIGFVKGSFYDRKLKQTVPTKDVEDVLGIDSSDKPEKPALIDSWQNAEEDVRALTAEDVRA